MFIFNLKTVVKELLTNAKPAQKSEKGYARTLANAKPAQKSEKGYARTPHERETRPKE
jgi:hypothetical protein